MYACNKLAEEFQGHVCSILDKASVDPTQAVRRQLTLLHDTGVLSAGEVRLAVRAFNQWLEACPEGIGVEDHCDAFVNKFAESGYTLPPSVDDIGARCGSWKAMESAALRLQQA